MELAAAYVTYRSIRPEVFYKKKCSEKIRKIHRKTPVLESLFNKIVDVRPEDCFHVNFANFFTKPFFVETPLAASQRVSTGKQLSFPHVRSYVFFFTLPRGLRT